MENSFVEDLFLEADKPTPSTEPKTAGTVGGAGIGEIRHEPDSGSKRQNVRAYPAETGGSTPPRSVPASEYAGEKQSKTKEDIVMTREELKSHLEANEARVEQMTDRVEQRLHAMDEKMSARLSQIQEVDERMEEREEKLFERVSSSLDQLRADREEQIGDLREEIGEVRGDFEAVKGLAEANFRNRRIMVGVIIAAVAIIQVLVSQFL